MTLSSEDQARLERLIGAGLASQPNIKAPATLQSLVLTELARRAALPWWHRSFRHWPMTMRIAFLLTALGVVRAVLSVTAWSDASHAAREIAAPVTGGLSWLQSAAAVYSTFGSLIHDLGETLFHRIPGLWLYAGIGGLVAMYAVLAGIGVTVYRTLDGAQARA